MAADSPRQARKRIVAHLHAMHAISPEDAVPHKPQGPAEQQELAAMRRSGIVREVAAGYYWIDRAALKADKDARERRLATISFFVAITVAGALLFFYRG